TFGADTGIIMGQRQPKLALPRFDPVPELVIDNAQLRYLLRDPFFDRVRPVLPLAGCRILDNALPVPDQPADIRRPCPHGGPRFHSPIAREVRIGSALRPSPPTSHPGWALLQDQQWRRPEAIHPCRHPTAASPAGLEDRACSRDLNQRS